MLPVIELSPANIKFTQARINDKFKNGNSVNETVEKITRGELHVQDLAPICVVELDGCYYTLGNRRLYVYRVLHFRGLLKTVEVHLASINRFQFERVSTKNNGKSVTVCRGTTLQNCETDTSCPKITRRYGNHNCDKFDRYEDEYLDKDYNRYKNNDRYDDRTPYADHDPYEDYNRYKDYKRYDDENNDGYEDDDYDDYDDYDDENNDRYEDDDYDDYDDYDDENNDRCEDDDYDDYDPVDNYNA